MIQPIIYSNFDFKFKYTFDETISIWIDNFNNIDNDISKYKIFIALEPNAISHINNHVKMFREKFNYILTFDDDLLKLKNAHLFEYGTKWMREDEYEKENLDKEFSVSFLCGRKHFTQNHGFRHEIWKKQSELNIPKKFYVSSFQGAIDDKSNLILGDRKVPLFDSMYHICVENINMNYYFSEKLIDTLLMKTIPIYYGAIKLSDYFNMDSIITFNNFEELKNIINNLDENFYKSKIDSILQNYNKALLWIDYEKDYMIY